MKKATVTLGLLTFYLIGGYGQVLINEIDSDTPGSDTEEFIELYDGGTGNTSLDGYVLVLYNGNNNSSYKTFDLTGHSTNTDGFFVIGSETVSNVNYTPPGFSSIQNGPDAVALYLADDAADYSIISTSGLIDAVVYDNGQADDTELLVLLNPGEPQVNEDMNGNGDIESLQRSPDGGEAKSTSTFIAAQPTPGTFNFTKDFDSDIIPPDEQIPSSYISSIEDSEEEYVKVFNFKIQDSGLTDGKSTSITEIVIETGVNNSVSDLTTIVAGARLMKNDILQSGASQINSESIHFDFTETPVVISDGGSEVLTLEIYLPKTVSDGDSLQFEIPSLHSFKSLSTGSDLITMAYGATGNVHVVNVIGTGFQFVSVPATIVVDTDFELSVHAVDENGNHDKDDDSSIATLSVQTGPGSLTSPADVSKTLSAGAALWTDLQYDHAESFVIQVTGGLKSAVSSPITAYPHDTRIYFEQASDTVSESKSSYAIIVKIEYPDTLSPTTADVVLISGDASVISYFSKEEVVFPAGSSAPQSINLNFQNDSIIDGAHNFIFELKNISGGKSATSEENTSLSLTVEDDEFPSAGDVIISEIMYDSKSSTDEEWIELYNTTKNPINISGWYLTDDDSYPANGEGDVIISDNTWVNTGEYLVIAWEDLFDFDGEIIVASGSGSRSLAPGFGNSGDNISLFSRADSTGVLVDGALDINYNDASPANEGVSIERDLINGYSGEWIPSTFEFGSEEIVRGTPGAINSTQFTRVQFKSTIAVASENEKFFDIPIIIENPNAKIPTVVQVELTAGDSTDISYFTTGAVGFPAGSDEEQNLRININDDEKIEESEVFSFKLLNISGGTEAYPGENITFNFTIQDNDTATIQFKDSKASISESAGVYNLVLTLSKPDPFHDITFEVKVNDNISTGIAEDIGNFNIKSVVFVAGSTEEQIIPLSITNDLFVEDDEVVYFEIKNITSGSAATAGGNQIFELTLTDDEFTIIEFDEEEISISENNDLLNIPILITNPHPEKPITVEAVTQMDLSTTDTNDVIELQGQTLTIPENTSTYSLTFIIKDDSLVEGEEYFYTKLQNIRGGNAASIGDKDNFKVKIDDNDFTTIFFEKNEGVVDEGDEGYSIVVGIDKPHPEIATKFDLIISDASTADSSDIIFLEENPITLEPGTADYKEVFINIADDNKIEDEEILIIEIENVSGGISVGESSLFKLSILDAKPIPTITSIYPDGVSDVKIYPVPASDFVTIDLGDKHEKAWVAFYNSSGNVIVEQGFIKKEVFDLRTFKSGLYTIVVYMENNIVQRKLLIIK